jgi:hypothetical protein
MAKIGGSDVGHVRSLAAPGHDHKFVRDAMGRDLKFSAKSCACRRNGPMNGPHEQ